MIKLWHSLLFIALVVLQIYLSTKFIGGVLGRATGGPMKSFLVTAVNVISLPLIFAMYWSLTDIFPAGLLLLLIGLYLIGMAIYFLFGAAMGIGVEDKQRKITALALIWSMQNQRLSCINMSLLALAYLVSVLGSLIVFWAHPFKDPNARFLITILLPVFLTVAGTVSTVFASWPIVTSEYLDDDFRNFRLINDLSLVLTNTAILFLPMWIFGQAVPAAYGGYTPAMWVLISLPLLAFLAGDLIPFFVGVYRYRAQSKLMLDWEVDWLKRTVAAHKLPPQPRSQALQDRVDGIEQQIKKSTERNTLLQFYHSALLPSAPAAQGATGPPGTSPGNTATQPQNVVQQVLLENADNLPEWDIRFKYLTELYELYNYADAAKTQDLSAFFTDRLNDKRTEQKTAPARKNVIAGLVLSGFSSAVIWAFKTFQSNIMDLLSSFAHRLPVSF